MKKLTDTETKGAAQSLSTATCSRWAAVDVPCLVRHLDSAHAELVAARIIAALSKHESYEEIGDAIECVEAAFVWLHSLPNAKDRFDANSHCPAPSGSGITANQEALAKDIARSLHEMSILRHGMFTPVEFEAIVANRIRSFFHSQNTKHRHADHEKR